MSEIIKTETCDSAIDLLEKLAPIHPMWTSINGEPNWLFRGQSDASWELLPSAMRLSAFSVYGAGGGGTISFACSHREQLRLEREAVDRFVQKCISLGLSLPEDGQIIRTDFIERVAGEHTNALERGVDWPHPLLRSLYALAQHHGVPTRLLDWSRSPWVAAYFACRSIARAAHYSNQGERDVDGTMVVWALHRRIFAESFEVGATLGHDIQEVTAPYNSNPNLHAQKGLFTLSRNTKALSLDERPSNLPFDEMVVRIVESTHAAPYRGGPYMVKLLLPKQHASDLLRELHRYGASAGALFPGFDGAVREIEEKMYWSVHSPRTQIRYP